MENKKWTYTNQEGRVQASDILLPPRGKSKSDLDIIFEVGFMNMDSIFIAVVLPEAVPPTNIIEACFSITYHNHAAISAEIVLLRIRSVIVNGFSWNFRMVKDEPLRVTSFS